MKKIFLTLAIMLAMVMSANAQFYIGGSLGLHAEKDICNYSLSPEVGYTFQGNTGVGVVFDFAADQDKATSFGVSPYFEYRFLEIDKFTLYLHTYLHYAVKTAPDMHPEHTYGISLHPGVIWNATDHWSAAFYFGGVEYMCTQASDTKFKDAKGEFNLGLAATVPFAISLYYGF